MKRFFVFYLLLNISYTHILKLPQCNKYDAIFSKITLNRRLIGGEITHIVTISLRKCLTKCMFHITCLSVNYMRQAEECQLLAITAQRNETGNALWATANGWNHFETDYNTKSVSEDLHVFFLKQVSAPWSDSAYMLKILLFLKK